MAIHHDHRGVWAQSEELASGNRSSDFVLIQEVRPPSRSIFQGLSLIGARQVPHFWLQLISVALFIVVGALFLRNPGESLLTLTLLLIVFFLIEGISKVTPSWFQ